MISRSPQEFLRRKGLVETHRPGPRFAPRDILVHKYETGQTPEKQRIAEGDPPPDRPFIKPWSSPT